ncbi:ATP-binding protein [Nocardia macrotermitis]|uniref:AAA+ ATPase domain-containing protein n=1 Tax=Nocardia macrotermitis TaxID=2585198 RepID=A0A7K0D368_9NOCA|nr:DUF87 domain-containing protein [Nocardia macrotermitis]MQY20165.1 hypothetical protein [Nocardia macrotermitis]
MNDEQRQALSAIQFSSVLGTEGIWSPLSHHVDGLHPRVVAEIESAVRTAKNRPRSQPVGLVLQGERGVGKTHMLGWLRQHTQEQGGSFFMPKLIVGGSFWAGAVHGIVNQLRGAGDQQLGRMIDVLGEQTGCDNELRVRLRGMPPVDRRNLDEFVERVRQFDEFSMRDYDDTLRALVLYQSGDRDLREIGQSFLSWEEGIEDVVKARWGFRARYRKPQLIFNDLSALFALTGPMVLAIDQVDTVITQSGRTDEARLADDLAGGLMAMREETVRTIVVAACIPKSWELIEQRAVNSAADRFRVLELRTAMPSTEVARTLVERHLAEQYEEIGFEPEYPSWPVAPTAFADDSVAHYTPRQLLKQVTEHVRRCLDLDTVTELEHFGETVDAAPAPLLPAHEMRGFDAEFERLRAAADVTAPLDPATEDERMVAVLNAALHCYVLEQGEEVLNLTLDRRTQVQPALHARLRRTLDEASEDEEHWSFRAIGHTNARAVLTRLRSACLEAGVEPGLQKRHLVVVRNLPFSGGAVTTRTLAEFEDAGGVALPVCEDDLRTYSALEQMVVSGRAGFSSWLLARQPAGRSQLFSSSVVGSGLIESSAEAVAVADFPAARESAVVVESIEAESPAAEDDSTGENVSGNATAVPGREVPSVCLGRTNSGREFRIPLELLRKHTALFAGSGSGKTVLLRRLVEETALQGVSSILIDSNNDLARMGDRWPRPPEGWGDADSQRAEQYFAETDVVVWTPGRESGRPIALNPLPDFAEVGGDADELRSAVDAAVAGLMPKTRLPRGQQNRGAAVLTEALTHFADEGGSELDDFVDLLSDLSPEVSTIRRAPQLAATMADELRAAMITDPVFRGAGNRLSPGDLLAPPPGKRARVSVISGIGLTDGQLETFVNQLNLALYAWIKQHPSLDRPVGSLLVLDEAQTFVPAQRPAVSKESTLRLATQARKYGMGLVYATQAPKSLHNVASGNTATQFYGRLGAAVQIRTVEELARARGSQIDDLLKLNAGQFYGATEGTAFTKLRTPMCLTHHANSALTEGEVLDRARKTR